MCECVGVCALEKQQNERVTGWQSGELGESETVREGADVVESEEGGRGREGKCERSNGGGQRLGERRRNIAPVDHAVREVPMGQGFQVPPHEARLEEVGYARHVLFHIHHGTETFVVRLSLLLFV